MKKESKKSRFGLGLVLTSLAAAAGATAVALLKKKKREEVYHEAELKAMNELDDLMAENLAEDCETCSCAESCAAADEPAEIADFPEEDLQEAPEEPIEDVAADSVSEEDTSL